MIRPFWLKRTARGFAPGFSVEFSEVPMEDFAHFTAQQARRVRSSVLDQIPGVGEKRRTELLRHFKSVKAIRSASLTELEAAVPKHTARAVYDYFRLPGEIP